MRTRGIAPVTVSLLLLGCSDDLIEVAPVCDDIGWPLGVAPVVAPPVPEFAVECAKGWADAVETRPALATEALPGAMWQALPDPAGGWVLLLLPEVYTDWKPWLAAQGVEPSSLPSHHVLARIEDDGSLGWVVPEYSFWTVQRAGDELWALATDLQSRAWLLAVDPRSGELIDAREWELEPRFNQLAAARDSTGGAWISTITDLGDNQVEQSLYRAASLHAVELVAIRTTPVPRYRPSGNLHAFDDGAVGWETAEQLEIIEPDGSVRWSRPGRHWAAGDLDSVLLTSLVPTEVGAGRALRLEKVALADGATLWTREHQRYVVSEPSRCDAEDCALTDFAHPVLRPDGGYLLLGQHAYPSDACPWQPLIMAVSAEGEAEWAHRVDVCGRAYLAAFRDDSKLELLGFTGEVSDWGWTSAWTRWFEG
ncbi:MAG: hypothetical protein R6X02_00985 [Enhygromyxa sp.]